MKRTPLLMFIVVLIFCSGCSSKENVQKQEEAGDMLYFNSMQQIYDIHNKVIGEVELYELVTQTEDSIIYTRLPNGGCESITVLEYYRYVLETKESIKLGTVNGWSCHAFDQAVIDNQLYLLITTGLENVEQCVLHLMEFDLEKNTMTEIMSQKQGFPYSPMSVVGERLLVTRILADGCELQEYNTETKILKTLKKLSFNEKTNSGEVIRAISSDQDTISLLIVDNGTGSKVTLRADVYDHEMKFLHTVDFTSITTDENELLQGVLHYEMNNGYVYYENFSYTKFMGKLEGNTLVQAQETDMDYTKVFDTKANEKTSVYYHSFSDHKKIYLRNHKDGTMKQATLHPEDERYWIVNASRDGSDNYLFSLYYKDPDTGEELVPRLYYVKSGELIFQ